MADTKTTGLTALTTLADGDLFMVVDVSDTTMDAAGTNKKITAANVRAYDQGVGELVFMSLNYR